MFLLCNDSRFVGRLVRQQASHFHCNVLKRVFPSVGCLQATLVPPYKELPTCKLPSLSMLRLHKPYITSWECRHRHLPVLQETSWWHCRSSFNMFVVFYRSTLPQFTQNSIKREICTKLKFTRAITDGHL